MSLCNTSILPFLVYFGVLLTSTYAASLVPPQTPTTVFVKLYINQLNKIDGVEQTFSSDFYMTSYWEDSRITGDEYDPVVDWNPQLEFSNVLGSATETISDPYLVLTNDEIDDTLASLSTSGVPRENQTWIKTDQRYIGDFLTVLNLRDFPFDKQNAIIKIESALFNNKIVSIKPYPTMMEGNVSAHILPKDFEVTEWDLEWEEGPVSITTTEHFYPVFDETYSQLRLDVALQRQHTYYMLKIVTGVILLVYMCIMVIALAVEEPDRMMGTLTVFLALVSFTFITGSDVPKVAYSTRIDTFILFSFFITFVMMTEHCVNYLIHEYLGEDDEHTSKADVLDRVNSKGLSGASRFMAKVRHRYSGIRTRKIDGLFAIVVSITYAIGTAIIFGQPVQQRV